MPEVPGFHRGEQRASIAGIEDRVVDDLAEEMRTLHPPGTAAAVGFEDEETLAGSDQYEQPTHVPTREPAARA